nr:ribonuclease H-like domain-containing protein [Tanacetum cinerariifolium]
KFLETVKFGNDQIAPILRYGDLAQGAITIKRVYYVEGLNHNLFSVGQFCDADLEVAFRKSTCFIRDLKGNDLLTGSRGTDLYSITLQDTTCPNLICLMAKAISSQAWLWHRRLSHLNFDTINLLSKNDIVVGLPKLKFVKDHLCSSCELGKAKRKSFHSKLTPSSKRRYTWTHFLRSKDEILEVLIDFLRLVQRGLQAQVRVRGLQAQVRVVRTDKGTEFLNQTLHAYFAAEGIQHQTFVARTPEQNGVVERRNRTLVEAARTMLSAAKVPLFFWAEAIATACFTQNRSRTMVLEHGSLSPTHLLACAFFSPGATVRCAKCGHPVNGPHCQGCSLLRDKLKEDLVSYFQNFQNISESSDDSTNVVNAPREPVVFKQDHGVNPLPIDECCCECGDALNGIFCQQCTCKSCGKGAHTGYNCPPKIPIISNPKPCNQTMNNDPPQTLPSFDSTCYSKKENSVPCVSKPNFADKSSNIFNPPPQPPIYYCEFYESNAQYGHYCTPQAPFLNPEPGYSQDFNFPQDIHDFQQQYFCCDQCGGPHKDFQC